VERDKPKIEQIDPFTDNFTWHMIFLQGFIKFDQGISENRADKNVWKNKNNDNNSEKET
jgi:hypothetical protein